MKQNVSAKTNKPESAAFLEEFCGHLLFSDTNSYNISLVADKCKLSFAEILITILVGKVADFADFVPYIYLKQAAK